MRDVSDLLPLLGEPRRGGGGAQLRSIADRWGVRFPDEFISILSAYGDYEVAGHIVLYGPETLERASVYRGGEYPPTLGDSASRVVFPRLDGLLEWATTSTGDAFCVRPREGGEWTVSTYDQLSFEWVDYDIGFSDWLYAALSGDHDFDILPPLGDERPLSMVPLNVDAMFAGGAS